MLVVVSEGVGLASFILVGFWFGREFAVRSAVKALLYNRIGDAGFVLALGTT